MIGRFLPCTIDGCLTVNPPGRARERNETRIRTSGIRLSVRGAFNPRLRRDGFDVARFMAIPHFCLDARDSLTSRTGLSIKIYHSYKTVHFSVILPFSRAT